jgi:hypothetical protein
VNQTDDLPEPASVAPAAPASPASPATADRLAAPDAATASASAPDPLASPVASSPSGAHFGRAVPWPPGPGQRGLAAPYPPGGVDPDPDAGRREERFYLRLVIAMVLVIVLGGFAISALGLFLGIGAGT